MERDPGDFDAMYVLESKPLAAEFVGCRLHLLLGVIAIQTYVSDVDAVLVKVPHEREVGRYGRD
jgi:hypothetical protein